MNIFNGRNTQALQTSINRAKMYDQSRTSEVNTDGTFLKGSLDGDLIKGGEGSRGGKVIGHTQSGKPIYDSFNHEGHKDFTKQDHFDAHDAHSKIMTNKNTSKQNVSKHFNEKNKHAKAGVEVKSSIIGKTTSGKDIYNDHNHESHKDFSHLDHKDAAKLHHELAHKDKTIEGLKKHADGAVHHWEQYYAKGGTHKDSEVIGKTKSGKEIYDKHNHPDHVNFTSEDHKDASDAHMKQLAENNGKHTSGYHDEQSASHYRKTDEYKNKK